MSGEEDVETQLTDVLKSAKKIVTRNKKLEARVSELEEIEDVAQTPVSTVFPNPTNSNVKVKLSGWDGDVVWELRDSMGSLIKSGEFASDQGYLLNVQLEELASGVYSLNIKNASYRTLNWVVKN